MRAIISRYPRAILCPIATEAEVTIPKPCRPDAIDLGILHVPAISDGKIIAIQLVPYRRTRVSMLSVAWVDEP